MSFYSIDFDRHPMPRSVDYVSPYLLRRCRSIEEVLKARGFRGCEADEAKAREARLSVGACRVLRGGRFDHGQGFQAGVGSERPHIHQAPSAVPGRRSE